MKEKVGYLLIIVGLALLGVFVFASTLYRFRHETMTETQLILWSLERWIYWVPSALICGSGLLLVAHKR